tara:strand:+ start:381 stop:524 length:144 start_codon:yes stop_codon:yes gene_type:complete
MQLWWEQEQRLHLIQHVLQEYKVVHQVYFVLRLLVEEAVEIIVDPKL